MSQPVEPDPNQLYVVAIPDPPQEGEVVRHVICRARATHEGGMAEFLDPLDGHTVGSCGCDWWHREAATLEVFLEAAADA